MSRDIKMNVLARSNVLARKDDDDIEKDEAWKPTDEQFDAYMARDYELATFNVDMVLTNAGRSQSMRDLKESLLHNIDTIERVLTSKIASGRVAEEKGRYSLRNVR